MKHWQFGKNRIMGRSGIGIISVCFLVTLIATLAFPKNKNAQEHIEKGNTLYKDGRYLAAIDEYNTAINLEPENLLAWENLGWAYWKSGDINTALNIWNNLLNLYPEDINVINRIASIYGNVYEYENAIKLYEKSLSIKPNQKEVFMGLAKVYTRMGNYQKAYETITIVKKDYPNEEAVLNLFATILERLSKYEDAMDVWQKLSQINPSSLDYRLNVAINQFRTGYYDKAATLARQILEEKPDHIEAMRILAEEAVTRNASQYAQQMFSEILKYNPKDIDALNRLGDIALADKDYDTAIKNSTLSLKIDPLQYNEYTKRAEAYFEKERYGESIKDYNFILSQNPNNTIAQMGLLWIYTKQNSYQKVFELFKLIQLNYPKGNVQIDMLSGSINMYAGNYLEAIKILNDYRNSLNKGIITSLLYHGISNKPNIAEEYTYVGDFKEHMQMLKEEGYSSITIPDIIAYHEKDISLPPKPILITFDDARKDAYIYADPILKELGFKATMFVPIGVIKRNPNVFSPFEELKKMFNSGRWDIQAHGLYAHIQIPIDKSRRKGDFLTNKKWLAEKHRLETNKEFYKRIKEDYIKNKEIIENKIPGVKVTAYAFPRGNFGQIDFTNYPDALGIVLSLLKKNYRYGLYQNIYYGQFVLEKDNMFIQRLPVDPGTKMEKLKKHLHDYNLWFRTLINLGEAYIWSRNFSKANEVLQEIPDKEHDVQYHILTGLLKREEGHLKQAEKEFQTVLELDKDNERIIKYLDELDMRLKPRLMPQFTYFRDKNKRQKNKYSAHFYKYLTEDLDLHLAYERAFFKDKGYEKINENQIYTELSFYPSINRGILASSKIRLFSDDSEVFAYQILGETPLTNRISTAFSFERDCVDTAAGILNEILYYRSKLYVDTQPLKSISASFQYEHNWYDDDNSKDHIHLIILRRLTKKSPEIFIGYGYRWADSEFDAPTYYTPKDLSANEIHLKCILSNERFSLTQYCVVGYGKEAGDSGLISTFETTIRYTPKKGLDLFAQATFDRTPTYNSREIRAGIEYRF